MISEQKLMQQCPSKTFQRARLLASSDQNILTKKCRFDQAGTHLSAFVVSSRGWNDSYRTSVTLDEANGQVQDYACTCPAAMRYDGPCKHCMALALSYSSKPERFMGYKSHRKPETTPCLAEFIKQSNIARMEPLSEEIDIEPTLTYGYRTWSAHFKIAGPKGSYVMKNITDFAERMEQGSYFSYGKNLAFVHAMSAFTPRGKEIASLIVRAVTSRKHSSLAHVWGSRAQETPARTIHLTDYELVDLLDALGGRQFIVEGADVGVRSKTKAHTVDENPELTIRFVKEPQGGFSVQRDDEIVFITCGSRMYVWHDDIFYNCSDDFAQSAAFLKTVYETESDLLYISEEDLPRFCAAALPRIEENIAVSASEEFDSYRPIPGSAEFYFDKTPKRIVCDAHVVYGAFRRMLRSGTWQWENAEATPPLPDDLLEARLANLVDRYADQIPANNRSAQSTNRVSAYIEMTDSDSVARLLFEGLKEFKEHAEVFTTPAFDRLISDKKPSVSMGVSLAGNLINLDVSATDLPEDELARLLASYRLKKKYHRLKNNVFLDIAELDLSQLDRIASDLDISAEQLSKGTIELPTYRAFYLDDELHDARRDGAFEAYIEQFNPTDIAAYRVPESLDATLRPYQREGFAWMNALADMGFGGILADEMGLGKSIQFISFVLSRLEEVRSAGPVLIVCPASLVFNWVEEFARFAPSVNVEAIVGTKQERTAARRKKNVDVMITSYDLLRIDIKDYLERTFFCQMLDEAQYIKNHGTLTARAVKRVSARHRFALTGTPMENRLSEIWSIFDFLMPGFLGSYMRFRERFELDIIGGDEQTAARLQKLIGAFMLRRIKGEVLPELPDKLESAVFVQMTGKQKQLYDAHEQRLRESLTAQRSKRRTAEEGESPATVEVLAELTRLRQICCDPRLLIENYREGGSKIEAIADLIESACNENQKTLVFSQFTSFLDLIAEKLDSLNISYFTITGATPKKQRLAMVNQFNEDDTPVFLVSLKAGGTGLNLTGASVVIHADPWWNAAAQNQATDRAHRIGQKNVVSVHKIIAHGTIEERILKLQESKNELADTILSSKGMTLSGLSREELIDLLCN